MHTLGSRAAFITAFGISCLCAGQAGAQDEEGAAPAADAATASTETDGEEHDSAPAYGDSSSGAAQEEAPPEKEEKHHHFIIGVDGSILGGVNRGRSDTGGSIDGRMGWHYSALGIFAFRPELGLGYNHLLGQEVGRVYGGVRLGLQFLLGVYAYGHLGYAWGDFSEGLTGDVGLAADLLVLSFIRPGIHVDYMGVEGGIKAVRGGLHLELAF